MLHLPRQHISLDVNGTRFELWRLWDDEDRLLCEHSLLVEDKTRFAQRLSMYEFYEKDHLTLPKAFLTLEYFFGPTSDQFDFRTASFYFPLLLTFRKSQGKFFYLLHIFDSKGGLGIKLHRIFKNGNHRSKVSIYIPPEDSEFSSLEIEQFFFNLYGYLLGSSSHVCQLPHLPFLNTVDYKNTIYGYRDGQIFEEYFESDTAYIQAIQDFDRIYGAIKVRQVSEKIHGLLKFVTT